MNLQNRFSWPGHALLLLAAVVLIIAATLELSSYRQYSCSALCVSELSQKGDYLLQASITYHGTALQNAPINAVLNRVYKSTMQTDLGSKLDFKAPLGLGLNSLVLTYDGSETTVQFFYFGGMLYMLLIPLGIIFLVLSRLLSEEFSKRDKVTFRVDVDWSASNNRLLNDAIENLEGKNKRTIKGLPELISDVSKEIAALSRVEGRNSVAKCTTYLSQKLEKEGIAYASYGSVSRNPFSKHAAVSRWFYEHSIISGESAKLTAKDPTSFLGANKILFGEDINLDLLSKMAMTKEKVRLIVFSDDELRQISETSKAYSKIGAVLLMLRITGILEVTQFGV
jgi:hypothetical protein